MNYDYWESFSDTLFEIYDREFSKEETIRIFEELPYKLKNIAYEWSMGDTCFRDEAYEHLIELKISNEKD